MVYLLIITTLQFHSAKPEVRFCAGSNPAHDVSEIYDDGKNGPAGNKSKLLSLVKHTTKKISSSSSTASLKYLLVITKH